MNAGLCLVGTCQFTTPGDGPKVSCASSNCDEGKGLSMSEPIVASTQYGDFKGTVSIDQADGRDLLRLLAARAKVPKGYYPVGFSVTAVGGGAHPGQRWYLTVFAVDAQIAVTGQELATYARKNDRVPVFGFREPVQPSELAELLAQGIKRFSVVAATRLMKGKPMVLLEDT
jgi:hypothetical protein